VNHVATPRFWACYHALPIKIQRQSDRAFELLKQDSSHPSLQFKQIGKVYSARIGLHYRALATKTATDMVWFWIGSHADYDKLLRS
jgi:hypothetical protein